MDALADGADVPLETRLCLSATQVETPLGLARPLQYFRTHYPPATARTGARYSTPTMRDAYVGSPRVKSPSGRRHRRMLGRTWGPFCPAFGTMPTRCI